MNLSSWRLATLLAAVASALLFAQAAFAAIPTYGVRIVHTYPHDRTAFTEGLFYLNGYLYESTGLEHQSMIRKVELRTGKVVQSRTLAPQYFGEGIVDWRGKLIQVTWRTQIGFVYDLATFKPLGRFSYAGEGWALTRNARQIIMSDGTPQIRFLDPRTLTEVRRITVTADGLPVQNVNELEWVKGEILANIWLTNSIARIDPATGRVLGWIDLGSLPDAGDSALDRDAVANGIAYDAKLDRLFVTGKRWPRLYEVRFVKRPARSGGPRG
ncbi:MAG: glutaminyl-peptide cyclotransferase [Caulobacterales bacterium]